jgi:hypothetical protein
MPCFNNLFVLQKHPSLFRDHLPILFNPILFQDLIFLKAVKFLEFTVPINQVHLEFPKVKPLNF